jgi:uncharacterized protein (TIGR02594 family)
MSVALKKPAPIDPPWLAHARTLIGIRETPGPANNSRIMSWAARTKGWLGAAYGQDSTPWCGLFVAECIAAAGFKPARGFVGLRAKAWASWGVNIGLTVPNPPLGTIAVFGRDGGGHVGFVVGVHRGGDLAILGGNQSDSVNIRRFPRSRLIALRWPAGVPVSAAAPVVELAGVRTTGEA